MIYDSYVSPVRFFEFFDSTPFGIAMRQCYSVHDAKARFLVFPVTPNREIEPNEINVQYVLDKGVYVKTYKGNPPQFIPAFPAA